MRKRKKRNAAALVRRAAFAMTFCMMIGCLEIPTFAEESLKGAGIENASGDNEETKKSGESGGEASSGENIEKKKPGESGEEASSGDNIEKKEPGESGEEASSGDNTESKEPGETRNEADSGNDAEEGKETASGNNTGNPEESLTNGATEAGKDKYGAFQGSVSGNDGKESSTEGIEKEELEKEKLEKEKKKLENQEENGEEPALPEIIDVVVPSAYTLALNPYRLPVRVGEDALSTEQIISGTYGIVNKSSGAQIVTVSFTVEDYTDGELLFVDSPEEAENAGRNVYAIYLAAVPANEEPVLIDGQPIGSDVSGDSLQNVGMGGAQEQAVTLYAGFNQIAFRLSGAVYGTESGEETEKDAVLPEDETERNTTLSEDGTESDTGLTEENLEGDMDLPEAGLEGEDNNSEEVSPIVLKGLSPDGKGVTAYTFYGVMNPDAEWEKLSGGIRLSVVYTYQKADGCEEIIEGTGALIHID